MKSLQEVHYTLHFLEDLFYNTLVTPNILNNKITLCGMDKTFLRVQQLWMEIYIKGCLQLAFPSFWHIWARMKVQQGTMLPRAPVISSNKKFVRMRLWVVTSPATEMQPSVEWNMEAVECCSRQEAKKNMVSTATGVCQWNMETFSFRSTVCYLAQISSDWKLWNCPCEISAVPGSSHKTHHCFWHLCWQFQFKEWMGM